MPDVVDPRAAALLAEGMTQGEVDYMMSGGRKTEGLEPSADGARASPATPAAAPEATPPPAPAAAAVPPGTLPVEDEPEDDPAELAKHPQIPYAQFRREERARKALAKQLRERDETLTSERASGQELREKWARVDERLRVFAAASESAPATPKEKPDREADPFGYMAWLEEKVESLAPKLEQVTTQIQERDAATELQTAYVNDARVYAGREPHFREAYNWLMANRDAELQAAGYTDKQERIRIISADEGDIVARALQARTRDPNAAGPAQIVYGLAKARGFQPAAAPSAPAANGASNGGAAPANGATNGAGAAPAGTPSVTEQVAAIQRGQAASRSLSSAGGSPAPQGIDLDKLIAMDDIEYRAYKAAMTPAQRKEFDGILGAMR